MCIKNDKNTGFFFCKMLLNLIKIQNTHTADHKTDWI